MCTLSSLWDQLQKALGPKTDTLRPSFRLPPHPTATPWPHCHTQPARASSRLYLVPTCALPTGLQKMLVSPQKHLSSLDFYVLLCFSFPSWRLAGCGTNTQQDRTDWVTLGVCVVFGSSQLCSLYFCVNTHAPLSVLSLGLSHSFYLVPEFRKGRSKSGVSICNPYVLFSLVLWL